MRHLFALAFIMLCVNINAQQHSAEQDKVISSIKNYFEDDRENIYLHLNKEHYLSGEEIWYKGYVTEKKTNMPFTLTSSVFVALSDHNGNVLQTSLNYTSSSLLRGHISIPDTLSTGQYYVHAYTNFMNNFEEDESSKFPIYVINTAQGNDIDESVVNYDSVRITLSPEGGNLINDVANTVGVHVFDCNGKGIAASGNIVDNTGKELISFTTNTQGYGRLSITPKSGEAYKAECIIKEKKFSASLPYAKSRGIAFSINNYTFADKTVFAFKTNAATLSEIRNQPLSLVIFQGKNVTLATVKFSDDTQLTITIPSSALSYGVNTVLLLDQNQNEIAHRLIYKADDPIAKTTVFGGTLKNGLARFNGQSALPSGNFSISVLPEKSADNAADIATTLLINNYLDSALQNPGYYFNTFSKQKHFELDSFLLCQEGKYKWMNIQHGIPEKKFDFDYGLSVKGKVNSTLSPKNDKKAYMLVNGIKLNTPLNEKAEFRFEKLMVTDSTDISFFILDKAGETLPAKMYLQLDNNRRKFVKSFAETTSNCFASFLKPAQQPFPKLRKNMIQLEQVDVKGKDKKALNKENATRFGNGSATGRKITADDAVHYTDILGYLKYNGFNVSTSGGQIRIISNNTSRNGSTGPAVYINDIMVYDYGMLQSYSLEQVDEIYINTFSFSPGSSGTIRIYLKKDAVLGKQKPSDLQVFKVLNGYQVYKGYKIPDYIDLHNEGFLKYGTIFWIPDVNTDADGKFDFSFPNVQQKTVRIVIQGIDPEGRLYSETRLLEIK